MIGADMFINAMFGVLDEGPLSTFLTQQQTTGDRVVDDFVFGSLDLESALNLGSPYGTTILLKPPAQHINEKFPDTLALYAIPENYFEVVNEDFYVPNEL